MRDPIERLRGLDGTSTEQPLLPASEVRRLGDRRRRRTRAALAVGTMAAVAAIAIPTAALNTGDDRGSPVAPATRTPATTQSPSPDEDAGGTSWTTEIPEDFPLDHDLSSPEGDPIQGPSADADGIDPLEICGRSHPVATEEAGDRLAARATGPEYLDGRELVTYPDDRSAQRAIDRLRSVVADCAGDDGVVWTEHDLTAGEESVAFSRTLELGLGTDIYAFARVGNAVLALDAGGEWDLESTVPDGLESLADRAEPMVEEMCVFAEAGCGEETGGPEDPGGPASALDDSHLTTADRLPELKNAGGWTQVDPQPVATLVCQGDWLTSLQPAEMVSREFRIDRPESELDPVQVNSAVLLFDDQEAADAAYDAVLGWLDDCDATWFDHQTVLQIGQRLTLVSHAEAAGPCPPVAQCPPTEQSDYTDWEDRVEATVRAVAGAAYWDLH